MQTSEFLFEKAKKIIPGGVNSPVRSFNGVGGIPVFFKKGQGAYMYDTQGKAYLDYIGSWGALILGHCHPAVVQELGEVIQLGTSFGAPCELEIKLAEKICNLMPNIEMLRMVNSGTEATMTAIRLARGITKRDKILKFEGCYHGHSDSLLVKAGSGVLTLGLPSSPGVCKDLVKHTLTAEFNNCDDLEQVFAKYGDELAAVIVEPVAGNMGCILPHQDFLKMMRDLCSKHGSLLIFDEVMTGFRVGLGGAQQYYDIKPDITTLGKVIGGGLPVGAIGGSKEVMENLAPIGNIYQAGTLSGNPLAMAAGYVTLNQISQNGFFEKLSSKTEKLVVGLREVAKGYNIPLCTSNIGAMFGLCFSELESINNFNDCKYSNIDLFKRFFHGMLAEGIYLAPSAFEAGFVSSAHTEEDLKRTVNSASLVFDKLTRER